MTLHYEIALGIVQAWILITFANATAMVINGLIKKGKP